MENNDKNLPTTVTPQNPQKLIVSDNSELAFLLDTARFEHLQRIGNLFANSGLVPKHFQGNQAGCSIAVQMAFRMNVDPFMLMQALYMVHGKPGMEGKFAIGLINVRGPFTGPLQWRFDGTKGDKKDVRNWDWSCTCFATHKISGQLCELTIHWETVLAEGWYDKDGSKWRTMPEQMFRYRTASWLARAYCPEVIFGMHFADEIHDDKIIDITPEKVPVAAAFTSALSGKGEYQVDASTSLPEPSAPAVIVPTPAKTKEQPAPKEPKPKAAKQAQSPEAQSPEAQPPVPTEGETTGPDLGAKEENLPQEPVPPVNNTGQKEPDTSDSLNKYGLVPMPEKTDGEFDPIPCEEALASVLQASGFNDPKKVAQRDMMLDTATEKKPRDQWTHFEYLTVYNIFQKLAIKAIGKKS